MSREVKQWFVPTYKKTTYTTLQKRDSNGSSRNRHSPRSTNKTVLRRRCRNGSRIPVLVSRLENQKKEETLNICSRASVSLLSAFSSNKNRKPKKRKEWTITPILLKKITNPNDNNRASEKSKEVISELSRQSQKKSVAKDDDSSTECNSKKVTSKISIATKTNINIKPPLRSETRKEYLKRVSTSSLIALKRIVSKKVRDYHSNVEEYNKLQQELQQLEQKNCLLTSQKSLTSSEKYKLLAEENKILLKNVTFKTKSMIPTRVPRAKTSESSIGSLKSFCSKAMSVEKIKRRKVKPELNISTMETTSFVPAGKLHHSPISFVERNKENIKKIKKLTAKKPVISKEEKRQRKKGYLAFRSLITEVKASPTDNRNVLNCTVEEQDSSGNHLDTLYAVLSGLGNLARQIPQFVRNIFPHVFSTSIDQETGMSRSSLLTKEERKRKRRMPKKYVPPWKEYKNVRREYNQTNTNISRHRQSRLGREADNQKGETNDLFEELHAPLTNVESKNTLSSQPQRAGVESKSMEDFYRRVDMMDKKSLPVQVDKKVSTSQQCCSKDVRSPRTLRRKSWKVDYGRPKTKPRKNNLSFLRMIWAAYQVFMNSSSTRKSENRESEMRTCISKSNPIKIKRTHIDTDDSGLLSGQLNLPEFCKLWKKTSRHKTKKYDKKVVYSYVASAMAKSSTSFICPILSDKHKPVIIVNGCMNTKKGKRLSKGQMKRKKGKNAPMTPSSLKSSSVPDIYYEAQENNSVDEVSVYTSPKNGTVAINSMNGDCTNIDGYIRHTEETGNVFLELIKQTSRTTSPKKNKGSNTSVYIDDPIRTCDFGCDVSFVVCKDEGDMTDFVLESKSYCTCESQYDHVEEEVKEEEYKHLPLEKDIGLDDLINLLKQEFIDDIPTVDSSS